MRKYEIASNGRTYCFRITSMYYLYFINCGTEVFILKRGSFFRGLSILPTTVSCMVPNPNLLTAEFSHTLHVLCEWICTA